MTRWTIGYRSVAAASGADGSPARDPPRHHHADAVIGMDGGTCQLQADPDLSSIPVIMLTIVDHETLGLARGASNYLVKPIDRDRLAVALDKHRRRADALDQTVTHA